MDKDIKRISIGKFEKMLNNDNTVTLNLDDVDGAEVVIKKVISLSDMLQFVNEVVEACIDGETGEYLPEVYDFAVRSAVLSYYANIALPSSLEDRYALLYQTKLYIDILNVVNISQFDSIKSAINRKIQYMLDIMTSAATEKINEIIAKFSDIAGDGEKIFNSISTENLPKVIDAFAKLSTVDVDDIAKVVADSKILEER